MALFNHATKEVTAKLVYYGPGLCGKTTNLQWIHEQLNFKSKGKLVSLATQTDRTLFFDFLPVELGTIRGMRTRMQIYTVPGQVFYEATRRMVLKGCDAVVFVADSQAAMLDANFESLQSLRRNLLANEIDPGIPMVIQYNKRDLPTALPVSVLNNRLNPRHLPHFEAVAFKGTGVEETLKGVTKLLFKALADFYGGTEADAASEEAATPAPSPAAGAPAAVKVRVPEPSSPSRPPSQVPEARPAVAAPRKTAPAAGAPSATKPAAPATSAPALTPAGSATPSPRPAPSASAPSAPAPSKPAATTAAGAGVAPGDTRAAPAPAPSAPKPAPPPSPPKAEPGVPPGATSVQPSAPASGTPAHATPPAAASPAPTTPPATAGREAVPSPAPASPSAIEADADEIDVELEPEEPPATIVIKSPHAGPTRSAAAAVASPGAAQASPTAKERAPSPGPPAATAAPGPPPTAAPTATPPPPAAPPSTRTPAEASPPPRRTATAAAATPRAESSGAGPAVFREPKSAAPADPAPRGEGLRADQWLYLLEGTQRGPLDIEDLVDLVLTSIPEDTKVWHPGLESWVRANQARQIAEEIPPPLPIPGAARGGLVDEDMPDFNTVPAQFRTALIADEDEAFRKYLAMPLAAQGFTIHEAADGSAAWQLVVQNRPWLILADVSMPEVDGFEFCRRVRSHPLLSHTPLLFISGSDKYKERYRALQIGADDFLSKQMPIRELLMRIQLLLTKYSDLGGDEKQAGMADAAGAFQGRIEVFGAPALLQMCAQGGLNGIFTAFAEDEANTAAVMGFREGHIISATVGTTAGAEAVYAYLAWEKGSFKFTPGDPGTGQPLAQSVEHLLLEGCRLLDESQRGGEEMDAPL